MSGEEDAARPVQDWLKSLPYKYRRELVGFIRDEADDLAGQISSNAPRKSGELASSVEVRRGRNSLELVVTAGGEKTTKQYNRRTKYDREVLIGQDTKGRVKQPVGESVTYDYALGTEFGNEHVPAQPFFHTTGVAFRPGYEQRLRDKLEEIGAKV